VDQEGGIVAYPIYAQQPSPRSRPTTVTIASYLLYVTAAVGLISAVLALSEVGTISDVYKSAYAGTANDGTEAVVVGSAVIGAVINILFAAGLAILAIFNNRGRQGARITTWVIGGISLCCSGSGVAGSALTSSINLDSGNGPSASEVQRQLSAALPSWYTAVTVLLAVLSLLAMLGAIILLALPASNAFFRRTPAGFDPSMAYGQQPPYPGQYPGYPGSAPPYPQYPGSAPPYPGQPNPGQPYPGQPYPGQPYPGQPGQPAPGQPPYGPPASGQSPAGPPPEGEGSEGEAPHTGSVPPTDPWNPPSDRPPTS
jgi:hypothetical protein